MRRARGVQIVLDPAPACPLPDALYGLTDIITPNPTEAETLVGFPVHDEKEAGWAAEALRGRGAKRVIVKMGARGAYVLDGERRGLVPAFKAQAVDTVAAGDAFNGALGATLDEGIGFSEAVRWGAAAGALSVTKPGAQPSMPDRDALRQMLSQGGSTTTTLRH